MKRRTRQLLVALAPGLVVAGCASTGTAHGEDGMVAFVVENRSRSTVVAHVQRTGDVPLQLGRVPGDSRRVFLVHHHWLGKETVLVATPNTVARLTELPAGDARTYATIPFSGHGAREVHWVIRDGEPISRVRRAGPVLPTVQR